MVFLLYSTIKGRVPAGYGAIVALGIIKKESKEERAAIKKLIEFMYEPLSYITFLHMAPGGMIPVLRDVAGNVFSYRLNTWPFNGLGQNRGNINGCR